jgi:hypothetical protein
MVIRHGEISSERALSFQENAEAQEMAPPSRLANRSCRAPHQAGLGLGLARPGIHLVS